MSELAKRFMEHSGKDQHGNLVLLFEDKMIKMVIREDSVPLLCCRDIIRAAGYISECAFGRFREIGCLETHQAPGYKFTSLHLPADVAAAFLKSSRVKGSRRLLDFMEQSLGVVVSQEHLKKRPIPAQGLPEQDGVEFRKIPGASLYCVGDDGSVWSSRKGEWVKLNAGLDKAGYYCVKFKSDVKELGPLRFQTKMSVHRLVLLAFKGVPYPKQMACHNNGDKLDNRPENLRWGSAKDNAEDTVRHGRTIKGEDSPRAVLDNNAVIAIRELWKRNHSARDISRLLWLPESAVSAAAQGKTWKHVV